MSDKDPKVAQKENLNTLLKVDISTPFKSYYDDEADSVTAINGTGPFDVLPGHYNFLTLLNPCDIVVRLKDEEKRVKISKGIMHVRNNKVTVFLDI